MPATGLKKVVTRGNKGMKKQEILLWEHLATNQVNWHRVCNMISYKRDVLERQSLSEVKMGRGSPICERLCKNIVEYFKNNVLQRQISSSTVHTIFKIFREISVHKGQGRRPLLDARDLRALRRHCITHRHDSVIDITKWAQEYFQKPLSVNTIRRAICRCQLKLSCKKEAICEHGPEAPSCRVGQDSFKMDFFKVEKWSDESKFNILVGNHVRRVLRAKEDGDLPACYQHSVQKPASRWYGGGGGYFSRTMQNHILQLLQLHGFIVQESGAELAFLQSRSFTYWEHLVHH